jgi:hypothetical protein
MRTERGEAIEMVARRYGYLPASFRWRGQRFDVLAVEQCWTILGTLPRRRFQVRCAAGTFRLEQAVRSDSWRVTAWPLRLRLVLRQPLATPRYPLPRGQRRTQVQPGWVAQMASRLPTREPKAGERSRGWKPTLQRT